MTQETIDAMVEHFYQGLLAEGSSPLLAVKQARALKGSMYRTYGIKEVSNVSTN